MKAKVIFDSCGPKGHGCPKVFKSEDGDYLVQGYMLKNADKDPLDAPEGEDVVRLPKEFFESMLKNMSVDKQS
jgi:hypothetical protein